jgi:hypothetical protein
LRVLALRHGKVVAHVEINPSEVKMLIDNWRAAIHALIKRLDAINVTLDSVATNTHPREDTENPEQTPITVQVELQLPEAVRSYYNSKNKKGKRLPVRQWLTLLISFLTLLAVVAYTLVTKRMWDEQIKANKISFQGLVFSQRAFVTVPFGIDVFAQPPRENDRIDFTVRFENSGSTPTKNAQLHVNSRLGPEIPVRYDFVDGQPGNIIPTVIGPKGFVSFTGASVSLAALRDVQGHRRHLFIDGWIIYFDRLDDTPKHITLFCREVDSIAGFINDTKTTVIPPQSLQVSYKSCPQHNCSDEECNGEPYGDKLVWTTVTK